MIKNLFLFTAFVFVQGLFGAQSQPATVANVQDAHVNQLELVKEVAQKYIFAAWPEFPALHSQAASKAVTYPKTTVKQTAKAINALFGSSGIKVDPTLMSYINAFYFYLEYCTKREYAAKVLYVAQKKKIDFATLLKSGWPALLAKVGKISYTSLDPRDSKDKNGWTEAWKNLDIALVATFTDEKKNMDAFWSEITGTSFWRAFDLTPMDCQNSLFWQDFVKILLVNSIHLDVNLLTARHQNEIVIFNYLPFLETAYYVPSFEEQRYSAELTQASLLLNEHARNRLLDESIEFGAIKTPKKSYDFEKILPAINAFEQSDVYSILASLSNPSPDSPYSPFIYKDGKIVGTQKIELPAPYRHEMIFMSMAIALQALLSDYFKGESLEPTIAAIDKAAGSLVPWILPYDSQDSIVLEDIPAIGEGIKAAQGAMNEDMLSAPSTDFDNESVQTQAFASWVESWGEKIKTDITSAGEAAFASAKDIAAIGNDEAQIFWYQSGLASLLNNVPPDQAAGAAAAYKDALDGDFKKFGDDVKTVIHDAGDALVISTPIYGTFLALGKILGDKNIAGDYENMLDSVVDALGDLVAGSIKISGAAVGRLSVDSVSLLANAILGLVTGGAGGTGTLLGANLQAFGYDMITSMLEVVTFTVDTLKDVLKDLIMAIGYLILLVTDAIVDVGAAVTVILNPQDALAQGLGNFYLQEQQAWSAHRRLISQVVTVGALLAIVIVPAVIGIAADIAAGPEAWPLLVAVAGLAVGVVATLGFGSFMIASGAQQDTQVANTKAEAKAYLEAFSAWIRNQEILSKAMQDSLIADYQEMLNSEIRNQQLGVGFYQNYYNSLASLVLEQASQGWGSYQVSALTSAANAKNLLNGDAGAAYGYSTHWITTNPSRGLLLYTPSRKTFSQEIAQIPATFSVKDESGNPIQESAFWFLQSVTKDQPADPTQSITFEVRLRPIYVLDKFFFGIGIGGIPLDEKAIMKEYRANIDRYDLAKMLIFKREGSDAPADLDVYEHPKGWLNPSISMPELSSGTWYHMLVTLNGGTMSVAVWPEGESQPAPTTVSVTPLPKQLPLNQIKYGLDKSGPLTPIKAVPLSIIYSGASIEYEIITPQESYASALDIKNKPLYPKPGSADWPATTEANRESQQRNLITSLQAPQFGGMALVPASSFELLKGVYVYTTPGNKDFVVFATMENGIPTNIGVSPAGIPGGSKPDVLVSVVTGAVYDSKDSISMYVPGVWSSYISQLDAAGVEMSSSVQAAVATAQKTYAKTLIGSFKVGAQPWVLSGNTTDFSAGQFIYKTTIGKLVDYVVLANLDESQDFAITQYNLPYNIQNKSINGLISLVSNNVYALNSSSPKYSSSIMAQFEAKFGKISIKTKSAISVAQKAYLAAQQPHAPSGPKPSSPSVNVSTKGGQPVVQPPPPPAPPAQSLSAQQQAAADQSDNSW